MSLWNPTSLCFILVRIDQLGGPTATVRQPPKTSLLIPASLGKMAACRMPQKKFKWYLRERFRDLSMSILLPSCLLHVTRGSGLPLAVHSRVTLLPSVLTLSPLDRLSSIFGGTRIEVRTVSRVLQWGPRW